MVEAFPPLAGLRGSGGVLELYELWGLGKWILSSESQVSLAALVRAYWRGASKAFIRNPKTLNPKLGVWVGGPWGISQVQG